MIWLVPGMQPNIDPTSVPRIIEGNDSFNSAQLGSVSRQPTFPVSPISCILLTLRRNSARPNSPSATDTSEMPPSRLVTPNV